MLFNLYINDLLNILKESDQCENFLAYADDIIIAGQGQKNLEDIITTVEN